jgi:sulfate permease, SulP family
VSAAIIALTLLFLTALFRTLPNAVLAAIVLVAVSNLLDWKEPVHLWKVDRRDFILLLVTFAATLAVGIEQGIVVGVVASLGSLIHEMSRPHSAVLGQLPGTRSYRNLSRHPEAVPPPGIAILRIDARLSFANAEFLRDRVRELAEASPAPRAFVFDFHAINGVDSTALHQLRELVDHLISIGIQPWFAGVKGPVMDRFRRAHLADALGAERFCLEVADAVEAAQHQAGLRPTPAGPADTHTSPELQEA